jgi:hypothetical protein
MVQKFKLRNGQVTVADRFDIFLKSFERIEQDNEVPGRSNGFLVIILMKRAVF